MGGYGLPSTTMAGEPFTFLTKADAMVSVLSQKSSDILQQWR
jgi:hypothetical protein